MEEKTSPPPPYYPGAPANPNPGYPTQQGYPQQQQGYPPQQPNYGQPQAPGQPQQVTTNVVIQQQTPSLGTGPTNLFCTRCQEWVVSSVTYDASSIAWIICMGLFISGFCFLIPWFICWIPFCIDSMKNVVHQCPKCYMNLGTRKFAGL